MTPLTTAVGVSVLAHGVHVALVLAGLWGLGALLLPHALDRLAHRSPTYGAVGGSRPTSDAYAVRIEQLRAAADAGTLATLASSAPLAAPAPPASPGAAVARPHHRRSLATLVVPLAVVGSLAAAGIHAAVVEPHLAERPLFGLFFTVLTLVQLGWGVAMLRPTQALVAIGLVGNLGVLALWVVSRTAGLPWGLLPEPEEIGAWDITCGAWELLVVVACVRLVARPLPERCAAWFAWHPAARGVVGLAGFSLAILTLMGGHHA